MKNLRFECTRCGNCCTDRNTIVNLTYIDILRIKNGLNLEMNELLDIIAFYVFDKPLTYEDKRKMIITPIETERGLAFVGLIKNTLGGCYFYDSENKKCLIYNLRPVFCKTFPFSFQIIDDKIDIFYTEKGIQYCPGINSEAPIIDYDYWFKLGKRTLDDLSKNQKIIEKWNHTVKDGKTVPTVKKFLLTIFDLTE